MTLLPQHVNEMGQALACPIHLLFHFTSGNLSKITLEDSNTFKLTFLGSCSQKKEILEWFDHYFQGDLLPFPIPLKAGKSQFNDRVLDQLKKIPIGQTASYRKIAVAMGSPMAARAVGNACHHNPFPLVIPCHRIVKSDGSLGGFAYGIEMKKKLLDFERALITLQI